MFTLTFIRSRIHYILALLPKLSLRRICTIIVALVSYLFKRDRSSIVPPLLIVNLTFRCNYSCIMCMKNAPGENPYKNPKSIDFETFSRLLRENGQYLSLVRLHGGEPLFYKEIDPLIDLMNKHRVPYSIITNGYLLTPAVCEKIVGRCVGVSLSIDAADPVVYRTMRRGGDIETVTKNIQHLEELKRARRSKTPILNISSVFFSFNMAELPKLVRYCSENGIGSLSAGEGWFYDTPFIREEEFLSHHPDLVRSSIEDARTLADDLGVILRLKFPSLKSRDSGEKTPVRKATGNIRSCMNLYVSAELHPDLSVIACCDAKAPFGSLADTGLRDIWNGPGYIDARRKLRNHEIPEACRGCMSLYS